MDDQVKNGISHRRKAADKLVTFIREKGDSIFS